jgi:excisionase family DNA binding protein
MSKEMDLEPISLSVEQAAKIIGISRGFAYDLASKGKLPGAYRMGKRILVHRPTLLADIEAMAARPSTEGHDDP